MEDPRTESLREYCYGLVLPIICAMGIIGNVLNLVVLTRRNMRGTAYIYMRGKLKSTHIAYTHICMYICMYILQRVLDHTHPQNGQVSSAY